MSRLCMSGRRLSRLLPIATLAWAACAVPALAQPDLNEIVRQAFERDRANEHRARQYTFHRRTRQSTLDGKGEVKGTESKTHDVTLLDGEEYERLIAVNGKPVDAKRELEEQRKLERSIEKRRNESPAQRQKRIAKVEKDREEERRWVREILNVFRFSLAGEESIGGVPTWVIAAEPKPGYEPEYRKARFLTKLHGKFWIAKSDYGWVKVEAETIDTVSFGLFLVRLARGSTFQLHQKRMEDDLWMMDEFRVRFEARAGLIKTFHKEVIGTFSNYRKFSAESELIVGGEGK
ncbi:MAG: hypothetical protein R2762_29000 [Bryobacteraceae bacterium]